MRFMHLADLHVGKRVNEFPMIDDQYFILDQILNVACDRDVDAIVVAGDVYDKSAPGNEAVAMVDWFLSEASAADFQVLVVSGNHDSAERVAYAHDLLALQGVHVSPVYDGTLEHVDLEDGFGTVRFWLVPFLNPARVRTFFPDEDIRTYTDALACAIRACSAEFDASMRNIAIAHQFVTCTGGETLRTDSELTLGGMDDVDAHVFDAFDYAALGHVHRPQRVGRDEVRYSGSPLKYSASEASGAKSVPIVELGAKGDPVGIDLVPLVPLHDMRRVRGPLALLVSEDVVAAADRKDYLFATLTDENPAADAASRLRSVYPNVMAIDYDNARTRAAGVLGTETPGERDRDPFELFRTFYEAQNGQAPSETQERIVREELERIEAI